MKFTENFLDSIDSMTIIEKLNQFKRLNIKNLNDNELFETIMNALLIDNRFLYITNSGIYQKGTLFFRVRKLSSSVISKMNFKNVQDFWEPPSSCVKSMGRLNRVGESLLYTSPSDPMVAIREMHLKENDWYVLIKYTAKRDVKVNIIGGIYDYNAIGFTKERAIINHELYNSFLRDEFSRDVGEGTEYLYRVSERIAKDYFDLPAEVQDAWCYSSVQDKEKYNVCFRPKTAHEILELSGAMICRKNSGDEISPRAIAVPDYDTDTVKFYQLGSDVQKRVFPEIVYAG